ncbi:MAG: hypothetical protein EOS58_22695 [Mesorhizobium sp.]|nr:MAG: hypothetical protein EOS58_22695 [Mesorhizobium sp.]
MRFDELNVALATLYLRLSGYFTTGLILHAPRKGGQNKGEIDCFAVRHHLHDQAARAVEMPPFLDIREGQIDLILCEVKSRNPEFNKSLQDPMNLGDALRWAGLFPHGDIDAVARRLIPLLDQGADKDAAREGIVEGNVRVRPLLCAPPLSEGDVKSWCLTGTELFRFLEQCLDPAMAPATCSRRYSYGLWGNAYADIIEWFKTKKRSVPATWDELYAHLNPPAARIERGVRSGPSPGLTIPEPE